ncbi:DUF2917 domain-containing protein [Diaphorobacter sp. HDW4A]|uniref:DUF2917 domain-containing protein n=1 Tax=Diaphorobacter sp. HDW4A TaxID=2714924 RepID=UPI001408C9D3|nr:DUF2917 domain-containing protein [Diaphorobacter sp. HDW4A]QIL81713.1 DUF2917 domain-containing protein [Diaphorobacter sp. HDW4A]
MTTIHVLNAQQFTHQPSPPSQTVERVDFFRMNTLRVGNAVSLRSREPMRLRLLACSGQAWVTQTVSDNAQAEDLFLFAGQLLDVAPGQHLVLEPAGEQAVRYQWERRAAEVTNG